LVFSAQLCLQLPAQQCAIAAEAQVVVCARDAVDGQLASPLQTTNGTTPLKL